MLERLILVAILAIATALATALVREWTARRSKQLQRQLPAWDALGDTPDGRPTLIAFSSPSCASCHSSQTPAIALAHEKHGHDQVRVIEVDVAGQPNVAKAFGVLTVPTTVVIGADGQQIVAINHGFAPSARLLEQLQRA